MVPPEADKLLSFDCCWPPEMAVNSCLILLLQSSLFFLSLPCSLSSLPLLCLRRRCAPCHLLVRWGGERGDGWLTEARLGPRQQWPTPRHWHWCFQVCMHTHTCTHTCMHTFHPEDNVWMCAREQPGHRLLCCVWERERDVCTGV